MNNQTAVAYINNMGRTVSAQATAIARDMWMWCLRRGMNLSAEYLPGKENTIADEESRAMKDRSDWMLTTEVFKRISCRFPHLNVDLFASRLTSQLLRYFSWRPDTAAEATDAFQQDWKPLKGYTNPQWNLIGRVISMVERQLSDVILITPIWLSQPWYPKLLSTLVSSPLRIPPRADLIKETWKECLPEIIPPP